MCKNGKNVENALYAEDVRLILLLAETAVLFEMVFAYEEYKYAV